MDSYAIVVRRLPGAPAQGAAVEDAPRVGVVRRVARRIGKIGLNLLFAAMMATVGIMMLPAALGYHRYIILTGSMTGTYDRGSIVYDLPVPVSQLKVGDPITYNPPSGYTTGVYKRVTHRIIWIGRGANGERAFRTKGDANKSPDAWKFMLGHGTQDRVVFHVPELGYLFVLLSLKEFREVIVGIPAVIMALFMIRGLWREGGEEVKRQKLAAAGWQQIEDPGPEVVLPPVDSPAAVRRPARIDFAGMTVARRSPEDPDAQSRPPPLHLGAGTRLRVWRVRGGGPRAAHEPDRRALAGRPLMPNDSAAACRLRVITLSLAAGSRVRDAAPVLT